MDFGIHQTVPHGQLFASTWLVILNWNTTRHPIQSFCIRSEMSFLLRRRNSDRLTRPLNTARHKDSSYGRPMTESLGRHAIRSVDEFFMRPADLRTLNIVRRCFALLLILKTHLLWRDRRLFFGEDSYLPVDAALRVVDTDTWNLFTLFPNTAFTVDVGLFGLVLLAVGLFAGILPRVSALLTLLLLTGFDHANILLVDAEDSVLRLFAFFLVFVPPAKQLHEAASAFHSDDDSTVVFPEWPRRLFQLQICLIYFCSAVQKSNGAEWLDGTALYYVLRLDDSTRFQLPLAIADSLTALKYLGWSVVVFEFAFPILIWSKRFRFPCLLAAIAFHLITDLCLNLHLFHWIMLAGLLSFVRYEKFIAVRNFILRAIPTKQKVTPA